MKRRLKYVFLWIISLLVHFQSFGSDGESLFVGNCVICHTIGHGKLIGPDLKNVQGRRTFDYFQAFVKNSQSVIKSGDSTAVSVYKEYDESIMPVHNFSDQEIHEIWNFIRSFEGETTFDYVAPVPVEPTSYSWIIFLTISFLLLGIAIIKRRQLLPFLEHLWNRTPHPKLSKKQWWAVLILLVVFGVIAEINSIGIFTGYQPKQPMLFSHETHAGKYKMSCKYCHYEAYKGEHGGMPSLMSCMNCHKYIRRSDLSDTLEITKLYLWVGFDPQTKEYSRKPQPEGWVQVYNLPDHARFNHVIHTKAGVTCTECHGKIETMQVVKQATPLSMKWCIDCHNRREVPLVGYYSEKDRRKQKGYKTLSVEDRANFALRNDTVYRKMKQLGGLDCYKCHN